MAAEGGEEVVTMFAWLGRLGFIGFAVLVLVGMVGCDIGGGSDDGDDGDDYKNVTVAFTVTVRNVETAEPIEGAKVKFAVLGYYWDDWEYTTVYTDAAGQATITDTAKRAIRFAGTVSCSGFTDQDIDSEDFDADATVERFLYLSVDSAGTSDPEDEEGAIYVPSSEHETIQEAIDAAETGTTIVVAPGDYAGNITFRNKYLVLKSEEGPDTTSISFCHEDSPTVSIAGVATEGGRVHHSWHCGLR